MTVNQLWSIEKSTRNIGNIWNESKNVNVLKDSRNCSGSFTSKPRAMDARYGWCSRMNPALDWSVLCRPCWARKADTTGVARLYTYVYGVGSPLDGRRRGFLIFSSMRKQASNYLLTELSEKDTAMIVDGAAFHRTDSITVPENIKLIALPPDSPQLNPIENFRKVMPESFFQILISIVWAGLNRISSIRSITLSKLNS